MTVSRRRRLEQPPSISIMFLMVVMVLTVTTTTHSVHAWSPPATNLSGATTTRQFRFNNRHYLSQSSAHENENDNPEPDNDDSSSYELQVSYEGSTCTITVTNDDKSILAALERNRDRLVSINIPSLPSDCRRGNCLTCTARHAQGSNVSALQRGDDGLSPYLSSLAAQQGYILTCSSKVTGHGLHLELGMNHNAWKALYRERLESEAATVAGWRAMAKTIRKADEENPRRWKQETETVLKETNYDH